MTDTSKPKRPLPPPLPMAAALFDLEVSQPPTGGEISSDDGAILLKDRADFDGLAHRDDVPGAAGVPEVKFLIMGIDGANPQLYFINSKKYQFHFDFARTALGSPLSLGEFNRVTYFSDARVNLAGTVLAHDSFSDRDHPRGIFAVEFWPTDPVSASLAIRAWKLIAAAMPFAKGMLSYHPSGARQVELYEGALEEFAKAGVPAILSAVLFANMHYSALNLGIGYGTLRIVDTRAPGLADIALFKSLPNDLTHVGGVLSEEPQTPLSHVNLRAKQNDTPNAFLKNASTDPKILPHLGSIVRYEVQAEDLVVTSATVEEMNAFYESQRPAEVQIPPRDLSITKIIDLDDAGHDSLPAIGAKAANLAELRKLLGHTIVPGGRGIPFWFYDRFMTENGLDDEARAMMADATFRKDAEARDKQLAAFRKTIKRSKVPSELSEALNAMRSEFPLDQPLRCRSSTNSEDLEGFNGAGLYDSFTHRPDEGPVEVTVKKVWASLWNLRAFDERDFYRIDHFEASMAVLVHPNFDNELANGVALTKNIYFPGFEGFYINVQVGEALVTNPDPNAVPEELLVMQDASDETGTMFETIFIRRSTLTKDGAPVLAPGQIDLLRDNLRLIQGHFRTVYNQQQNDAFAMDVEFKFDVSGGLVIKQARPWVD